MLFREAAGVLLHLNLIAPSWHKIPESPFRLLELGHDHSTIKLRTGMNIVGSPWRAAVLVAATAGLVAGCGGLGEQGSTARTVTAADAAATTTSAAPTTTTTAAAPAPNNQTVIVVPQGAPSTVTQYQTVPPVYAPSYGSGSYSDTDFLARLNARGITTPSAATRTAGGQNVCYQLGAGSTLSTEANKLLGAPYNYWDALAGYFVGEGVKVYCPQYSYLLTS